MESQAESSHYTYACSAIHSEQTNIKDKSPDDETAWLMLLDGTPDGLGIDSISYGDDVSSIQVEDGLSARPEPIHQGDQRHRILPQDTVDNSNNLSYYDIADTSTPRNSSNVSSGHTFQSRHWLPLYLRRPTFITFAVLLAIMIMALETLFYISRRYQGLTESRSNLSYVWTYGPTTVLTIIRAFWNRVDYEAKITAPWRASYKSQSSFRDALLLDYIDMSPLTVPFRALRQGDYMVAASATVSLLFTLLIVLSTSLFTLSSVKLVDETIPITLENQFVNNRDRLRVPSDLPLYAIHGLTYANLSYPKGCSNEFAYQSFTPEVSGVTELRAVVEGMSLGFDCAQATISDIQISNSLDPVTYSPSFNVTLTYGDCNSTITSIELPGWYANSSIGTVFTEHNVNLVTIEGFTPGYCDSHDITHKRLAFVSTEIQYQLVKKASTIYSNESTTLLEFKVTDTKSASIVCAPNYSIVSVDVLQIGTEMKSISRQANSAPRTFPNIYAWDVIEGQGYSAKCVLCSQSLQKINIGSMNIFVGRDAIPILDTCGGLCPNVSSLLNTAILEKILVRYYQTYASFHFQTLLQPANIKSTATASRVMDRLIVQSLACQSMVGIMVIIMTILTSLSLMPLGIMTYPVEPGSILATASLIGYSTATSFPRDLGATDEKTLIRSLGIPEQSSGVHTMANTSTGVKLRNKALNNGHPGLTNDMKPKFPLVLMPASRIAVYLLIVACMVAFGILLRNSIRDQGLGDVKDETYFHYMWTLFPAALLNILALFFSSVDSHTQLLAPYYALTLVAPVGSCLNLNLSRPLLPWALYQQLQTGSLAALMTSLVTLVTAFFSISVGSLYQPRTIRFSSAVRLQTTRTFRMSFSETDFEEDNIYFGSLSKDGELFPVLSHPLGYWNSNLTNNFGFVPSLILENNLSFTPLTYQNLVFPDLTVESSVETSDFQIIENSSTSIHITVPALRPRLSCRFYPESEIASTFFYNQSFWDGTELTSDGIAINIIEETCRQGSGLYVPEINDLLSNNARTFTMDVHGEGLFAAAYNNRTGVSSRCSYFIYVWGSYSTLESPSISASALGCNDTLEAVDVELTLIGPQLQLDPMQPPRPIESTARLVSTKIEFEGESFDTGSLLSLILYQNLASLPPYSNETVFDPFFQQLVTSRYAIPVSAVSDPSRNETVRDAIIFQHGVIAAQYYSQRFRTKVDVALNKTNGSTRAIFPPISSAPLTGDSGVYNGTISSQYGRRRLIQDPVSTFVIEGLLFTTLVLSLLGWALGPRKAILPRSPTSIASVLALLAGGNILEHMYKDENTHWEKIEDAKSVFPDDCKFWMGWGPPGISEGGDEKQFGIWMIRNTDG